MSDHHYLAFDLGAESGRAIAARLDGGALTVREVCRFANEPVRQNGALHWDVLRLWLEMTRALHDARDTRFDSVAVDGWGVDYALIGERGNLLENPYHYRDPRNEGIMPQVFERVSRERIYAITGIQFLQINTLVQLFAACRASQSLTRLKKTKQRPLPASAGSGSTLHRRTNDTASRCWAGLIL